MALSKPRLLARVLALACWLIGADRRAPSRQATWLPRAGPPPGSARRTSGADPQVRVRSALDQHARARCTCRSPPPRHFFVSLAPIPGRLTGARRPCTPQVTRRGRRSPRWPPSVCTQQRWSGLPAGTALLGLRPRAYYALRGYGSCRWLSRSTEPARHLLQGGRSEHDGLNGSREETPLRRRNRTSCLGTRAIRRDRVKSKPRSRSTVQHQGRLLRDCSSTAPIR